MRAVFVVCLFAATTLAGCHAAPGPDMPTTTESFVVYVPNYGNCTLVWAHRTDSVSWGGGGSGGLVVIGCDTTNEPREGP